MERAASPCPLSTACADDFGNVGRRVERQRNDAGGKTLKIHAQNNPVGIFDKVQLEIDNPELNQQGRSADHGDVKLGKATEQLVVGQPHDAQQASQNGAHKNDCQRQQNGGLRAAQKIAVVVCENLEDDQAKTPLLV